MKPLKFVFILSTVIATSVVCGGCDTPQPVDPDLTRIAITTKPSKLSYYVGEKFSTKGMVVTATWNDGTKKAVDDYKYSPDGALKLADTKIHITYYGKEVYQSITVLERSSGDETYYKTIDPESPTLLNDLRTLNKNNIKKTYSYDGLKALFKYTDADPDGSGKILGFYDNHLVGPGWDSAKTWNREHVWPDSLGGNKVEGDPHMVRPAWVDSNSDRGNKYYAKNNAYDPGELGHPDYRGIAARIIFYCVVANGGLGLVDKESGGGSNKMGKLSDLLEWNLQYPPTTSETASAELRCEQNRNNVIQEKYQGNRNPFIDHPEYACKIWGTTNSATRRVCGL